MLTIICITILAYCIMGKDIRSLLEKVKDANWQGKTKELYDDQMKEVFGGNFAMLEVVDADHIYTMPKEGGAKQRYNLKGELLDDIVIYSTSQLTYNTDKLQQVKNEDGYNEIVIVEDIATCLRYFVGAGYNGLMTQSGKIVTPAIYNDIEAIGKDLYRCEYDDEHSVILNSQGQKVK